MPRRRTQSFPRSFVILRRRRNHFRVGKCISILFGVLEDNRHPQSPQPDLVSGLERVDLAVFQSRTVEKSVIRAVHIDQGQRIGLALKDGVQTRHAVQVRLVGAQVNIGHGVIRGVPPKRDHRLDEEFKRLNCPTKGQHQL